MKNAIKFSGMAFQMGATIGLGAYAGYRWDLADGRWAEGETAWATVGCTLAATLIALTLIIRQVLNDSK
ncbi:MAG: hypothetical protein RLZZ02_837 [Bacteroidota bacterium]|jgi:hypothetical protein|nr:hypothetical protein [Schleiferiaceae bacterium]